jgi:hypothetical protein
MTVVVVVAMGKALRLQGLRSLSRSIWVILRVPCLQQVVGMQLKMLCEGINLRLLLLQRAFVSLHGLKLKMILQQQQQQLAQQGR